MANTVVKRTFEFSAALVLICAVCPTISLHHHIAQCETVRPCVCEFPSGEGIDLSDLSNSNNTLSANMTVNVTVYFQPCNIIKVQNISTCNATSLCIFNRTDNVSTVLGDIADLKFSSENLVKPVLLEFIHGEIKSTVELSCADNNVTSFNGSQEANKEYRFNLRSPAACLRPLEVHPPRSMFSVLLISSLIVLCTYLIAMIIVRHSRGAVGWELLPHHELCIGFPSMCRAGFNSLRSCCRLQPSYEQI